MIDFRLYLVTDRTVLKTASLEVAVLDACKAGARAFELREKDLDAKSLLYLAESLRRITAPRRAKLLVNDRVDVALAAGADGVHCPENGFPPWAVRRIVAARFVSDEFSPGRDSPLREAGGVATRDGGRVRTLVGASTHSVESAVQAEKDGADFVTFGPIFETPSKTRYGPPQGLERLREVTRSVRIPVFAIGGVTPERAKACLENGAWGVAAVSAVFASPDIPGAVARFAEALGAL